MNIHSLNARQHPSLSPAASPATSSAPSPRDESSAPAAKATPAAADAVAPSLTLVVPQARGAGLRADSPRATAGERSGGVGSVPQTSQAQSSTAISDAPNRFQVRLIDLSGVPHAEVPAKLHAAVVAAGEKTGEDDKRDEGEKFKEGQRKRAFLIPGDCPVPAGYRQIGQGHELKVHDDQVPQPAGSVLEAARLVVPEKSLVPHIQGGKKAAGHVGITVELTVPASVAAALRQQRGTPMFQAAFLKLAAEAQEAQEAQEVVTVAVNGIAGKVATDKAYANNYTNFGGSADVTAEGVLETGEQAIRREVAEEAGAVVELLGSVRASTAVKKRQVDVGGPYFIEVADAYSSAVSTRAMSLAAFHEVLGRARPQAREIKEIAVHCLPSAHSAQQLIEQAGGQAGFEAYLREVWFAPAVAPQDANAQEKAGKTAARLSGLASKVFASRGDFGPGYPETW